MINAENGTEFISRDNMYNRSMENVIYNEVDFSRMDKIETVDVTSMVMPLADTGRVLSIPNRTQGSNNNLCWAACVSSVGQYKTGVTKSIFTIADENGIGYNTGATLGETGAALRENSFKVGNVAVYSILYFTMIKSNIDIGNPLISRMDMKIRWNVDSEGKPIFEKIAEHAVSPCGYSSTSSGDTITYMEPRGGLKRTVNKTSTGKFEFSEYSSE